jgi:hypothetical protein
LNWAPQLPFKKRIFSLRVWEVDSHCLPLHLMNNRFYFIFLKTLLSLFVNWHWGPCVNETRGSKPLGKVTSLATYNINRPDEEVANSNLELSKFHPVKLAFQIISFQSKYVPILHGNLIHEPLTLYKNLVYRSILKRRLCVPVFLPVLNLPPPNS